VVFLFHTTNIRERWLQPVLICAPVLAAALMQDRINPTRLRWLIRGTLAVLLLVAVLIPARVVFAERIQREERLTRPYDTLAAQIRPAVPEGSVVVTDLRLLAGNLRLSLPNRLFVSCDLTSLFPEDGRHCFLAWDATRSHEPPKALLDWAATKFSSPSTWSQPKHYTATYKFYRVKQLELGLIQVK